MTFWIVTGFVFWAIAALGLVFGAFPIGEEYSIVAGVATFVVGVMAGIGFFFAANATWGWFDSPGPPPDGCYMVRHDTSFVPMSVGKTTTVIPYDDVSWYPIACPAA